MEELSVRKSEKSEAGEDSNSDEIEGSDDGEPDKIQMLAYEIWQANKLSADCLLPLDKAKEAIKEYLKTEIGLKGSELKQAT